MHINARHIGPGNPPYLIAEIGVNHDGSVDRALDLVRAASAAGADAIKLQYFQTDRLLSTAAKLAAYQKAAGETDPIAMLRRLELSLEQMQPVVALAHKLNLHAIVTVFSLELVNPSTQLPFDAYKSASPDLINRPLLKAMASTQKPFILSTGASTLDEIKRTLTWLSNTHDQLAALHCVSSYPTPPDRASLEGIAALATLFPGPVGYSDHTAAVETAARAVAAGAHLLEKHLTYSQNAEGPDHAASLNPDQFKDYVTLAKSTFREITQHPNLSDAPDPTPKKTVLDIEQDVRHVSRQSLTTTRNLDAGHTLARSDLTIKRPGVGIEPFHLDATIGRQLANAVKADTPLQPTDLEP
jgi:N,N'-diacetyllegionaminate synthase